MKGGFGGQALNIHPEKEIIIAYFNYMDKDWEMKIISDHALHELLKALDSPN